MAIVGFRVAAPLRENLRLLQRRAAEGRVRPPDWRSGTYRSLVVLADGTCRLERRSPAALARQLQGGATPAGTGK